MTTSLNQSSELQPHRPAHSKLMRNLVAGVSAAALLAGIGLTEFAYAVPSVTS
jgi:hypothetical protein